jgi:RecA-family ATPase
MPIDIAQDLGVVPEELPPLETITELVDSNPQAPPQIIDGLLHKGCVMVLGGTSKSNKSWCLLDLAVSVATGQPWWGLPTSQTLVCMLNLELKRWSIAKRLEAIAGARPECRPLGNNPLLWNLRGKARDLTMLRPQIEDRLGALGVGLIIIDPIYKMLGDRDENSNGDIALLMNEVELLAENTGAAVVFAHHYAKGDSTQKAEADRMSGAGSWVRSPDTIVTMTPHEEEDCFTVNTILRNLARKDPFVVAWQFPKFRVADELNPDALRRPQSKLKTCTDLEFIDSLLTSQPKSRANIVSEAKEAFEMSRGSVDRYLKRLSTNGLIGQSAGVYWRKS